MARASQGLAAVRGRQLSDADDKWPATRPTTRVKPSTSSTGQPTSRARHQGVVLDSQEFVSPRPACRSAAHREGRRGDLAALAALSLEGVFSARVMRAGKTAGHRERRRNLATGGRLGRYQHHRPKDDVHSFRASKPPAGKSDPRRHCCIEPEGADEAQRSGGSPYSTTAKKDSNHSIVSMICRVCVAEWRQPDGASGSMQQCPDRRRGAAGHPGPAAARPARAVGGRRGHRAPARRPADRLTPRRVALVHPATPSRAREPAGHPGPARCRVAAWWQAVRRCRRGRGGGTRPARRRPAPRR
jgi:hypothetical protein